jgi:dihydroflavonol-4-reductase
MSTTSIVTGAAGFVGRHLVNRLIADGWDVVAFCRQGDRTDLLPDVRIVMGDLGDAESLARAFAGTQHPVVFHLAGNTTTWSRNHDAQLRDNVGGTRGVIEAAERAGARRLVVTSSTSAYGHQPGVRLSETSPSTVARTGDNYGKSKWAAEQLVKAASVAGRLSTVILNPVNILGAYDDANWSKQLILPIADDGLRVVPPGSATWISVHDVVTAQIAAVEAPLEGENVILGGTEATFLEVVQTISRLLDKPVPERATPRALLGLAFLAPLGSPSGSSSQRVAVERHRAENARYRAPAPSPAPAHPGDHRGPPGVRVSALHQLPDHGVTRHDRGHSGRVGRHRGPRRGDHG